jgi:hypothetical protein
MRLHSRNHGHFCDQKSREILSQEKSDALHVSSKGGWNKAGVNAVWFKGEKAESGNVPAFIEQRTLTLSARIHVAAADHHLSVMRGRARPGSRSFMFSDLVSRSYVGDHDCVHLCRSIPRASG